MGRGRRDMGKKSKTVLAPLLNPHNGSIILQGSVPTPPEMDLH